MPSLLVGWLEKAISMSPKSRQRSFFSQHFFKKWGFNRLVLEHLTVRRIPSDHFTVVQKVSHCHWNTRVRPDLLNVLLAQSQSRPGWLVKRKKKKKKRKKSLSENLSSSYLNNKLAKVSSWEQLMILGSNSAVQPEMTFTLSHKLQMSHLWRSHVCVCINSITWSKFFENEKILTHPGSSNKTLSRSGLIF